MWASVLAKVIGSKKLNKRIPLQDLKRTYTLLRPFISQQKGTYAILLVLMILDVVLTILFAWYFGAVTNAAIQSDFHKIRTFIPIGLCLLSLNMISYFCGIYIQTYASQTTKRDLKNFLFHHILRLPASDLNERRAGDLISHFTTDIHSVDGFLGNNLITLLRLPIIYGAVLIYLLHLNWMLCVLSIGLSPLALIASLIFGKLLRRNGSQMFRLYGTWNGILNETFHGLSVIRSFTLETLFYKRFKAKNQKLLDLELENAKLQGFFYTGSQLVGSITFLTCLTLGAYLISKGHLTVGALITFINLVSHLIDPLTGMAREWASFQKAISAIERVLDVLETPPMTESLPVYVPVVQPMNTSVEFRNLTFRYTEEQSLFRNFDLEIPAGHRVAIVGPSGAGKTTLFNLIQGMYVPQDGDISIGNRPIDAYTLSELRSLISIVPQETFLFSGSIRENLGMARPGVTDDDMHQVIELAQLTSYIKSLPHGLDTEIGERGVKLSGGQKQRLAIARAILKGAPILLLDEATSALDQHTEAQVQQALDALMKNRTTIVIAHRLSTVQNADLIVVIDEGKCVQMGTHEELMTCPGLYRTMNTTAHTETEFVRMLSQ